VSISKRLAAALLADRDQPTTHHNIVACFVCGYTFIYRGRRGDLSGRFCSMRCQDWYDAGNAPTADLKVVYRYRDGRPMRMGPKGFYIDCAHCRKEFESIGLRCCSTGCERRLNERQKNLAAMAEVGAEPATKRICERPGCGATIPKWRKGRRVSSATRFCSGKCARKTGKAT
jgi:hypothetical protein